MSFNLLDIVKEQVGGSVLEQISGKLGESPEKTEKAISGAVPALLSGLMNKASSTEGANELLKTLSMQDEGILDNIGGAITGDSDLAKSGGNMLKSLLGESGLGNIVGLISKFSGIGKGSSSKLLGMLAPLLMGNIKRKLLSGGGLNPANLSSLLMSQKDNIAAAMPEGLDLGSVGLDNLDEFKQSLVEGANKAVSSVSSSSQKASDAVKSSVSNVKPSGSNPLMRWLLPLVLLLGLGYLAFSLLNRNNNPVTDVVDTAKTAAQSATEKATNAVSNAAETATKAAGEAVSTASETVAKAAEGAVDTAGDAVNAAGKAVGNAAEGAVDAAGNAVNATGEAVANVAEGAANAAGKAVNAAGEVVNAAGEVVGNAAETAADAAGDAAKSVANAAEGAVDATGNAVNAAGEAVKTAGDAVGNAAEGAVNAAGDAVNAAGEAVGNAAEGAAKATGNALSTAADTVETATNAAAAAGTAATAAIASSFEGIAGLKDTVVGNINVGKELLASTQSLTETLGSIHNVESAKSALPKLTQINGDLSALTEALPSISDAGKAGLSKAVNSVLPQIKKSINTVSALPGVGKIVQSTTDELVANLDKFVK